MKKNKIAVKMVEMIAEDGMELVLPDGDRVKHAFVPSGKESVFVEMIEETDEERKARLKAKEEARIEKKTK